MRTGVKIKEDELIYSIRCTRCKALLFFPASLVRKDAVMKAKTRHGWMTEDGELYCDGCSDKHGLIDKQPRKTPAKNDVKTQPKSQPEDDDGNEYIELGE